jgi:hypothetical protein
MLAAQAAGPAETLCAFCSEDDTRPDRAARSDEPLDLARVMREWNRDEDCEMVPGTPDHFGRALEACRQELPRVEGTVEPTDVNYNGPFCAEALRPRRDAAAAELVEAGMYAAFSGQESSQGETDELGRAWRLALRAQSHGVQYLFAEDLEEIRRDLAAARRTAGKVRTRSLRSLARVALPQDAGSMTLFSCHARRPSTLVRVHVLRTDLQVAGYRLTDESGVPLPQQALELCDPAKPHEWDLLVDCPLPQFGSRSLRIEPLAERAFAEAAEPDRDGRVSAGPWTVSWDAGRLAEIEGGGCRLAASEGASILEPLFHSAETRGWMTTAVDPAAERPGVDALRQVEFGPLRWRFERSAAARGHRVFQTIDFLADGGIEVSTEVDFAVDSCYVGLALPCARGSRLTASVPFGVEERDLDRTVYSDDTRGARSIERLVPGMFYARDWVRARSDESPYALVVLDGDRYWYRPAGGGCLEHFLLRVARPAREGWERYTRLHGAGRAAFRHALVLGPAADDDARLSHVADAARFPVRAEYTAGGPAPRHEWLRVEPGHLRVTSCREVNGELEIRLVEAGGRAARAEVTLDREIEAARLTDFQGSPLEEGPERSGTRISFPIGAWQIRTLRMTLRRGPGPV